MIIIQASPDQLPPPPDSASSEQGEERSAPRRRRVIVVDDERLIADTVAQILNIHGYDAFAAYSSANALKLAEGFQPDVLLSDVVMPGMNGIQLASHLKLQQPHLKVLLLSGQAGTSELVRVSDVDFKLEAKPIHPEKLLAAIAKLEAGKR